MAPIRDRRHIKLPRQPLPTLFKFYLGHKLDGWPFWCLITRIELSKSYFLQVPGNDCILVDAAICPKPLFLEERACACFEAAGYEVCRNAIIYRKIIKCNLLSVPSSRTVKSIG